MCITVGSGDENDTSFFTSDQDALAFLPWPYLLNDGLYCSNIRFQRATSTVLWLTHCSPAGASLSVNCYLRMRSRLIWCSL
jgi:hypothetical protein